MVVKRAYRRTDVNKISCTSLLTLVESRSGSNTVVGVGLDIGKSEIVATVRWGDNRDDDTICR